jgi:hypothetical protein
MLRHAIFALSFVALASCSSCNRSRTDSSYAARDAAPPWFQPNVTSHAPPDAAAPIASSTAGAINTGGCSLAPTVEGDAAPPIPSRPKPTKGVIKEEPTFHTCFVRATDHVAEGIDTFSRNDYSRRQPFNADSSLFLTSTYDGSWRLYDAKSFTLLGPVKELSGDAEPQWHPTDPNILYWGERNGGMAISALDLRTKTSKVVIDLKGKLPWAGAARSWTKSEGSPSKDGRYWGFQVETDRFDILGFAVWDLVENKLVGSIATKSRPDHVSMSPTGRWFVSSGDETTAWSPDFSTHKKIRKGGEHSDIALGANGHDYYVSIDYDDGGYVFMTDLETLERTNLFRTYINHAATAMHFSGKAFDKPGWIVISTYTGLGPTQWYFDKILAVELAKEPRIYQLAAHHSAVGGEYFAEPQASVNRDFTRIVFNSNWGVTKSKDVDAYMVLLPNAPPAAPSSSPAPSASP